MKVAIGSDHAGFDVKEKLIDYLCKSGYEVYDKGTFSTESMDYPDIAFKVAEAVACGENERGILICGTGIGMSIAANKVSGIRAALCHDINTAVMSREHNDANILVMGARVSDDDLILNMTIKWFETDFLGDRHQKRLDKILAYGENLKCQN